MSTTARERAVAALTEQRWRTPDEPFARDSAHTGHRYDPACALCRPDLDDGYGRIVDVVLAAVLRPEERADTELDEHLSTARVRFWQCPVPEHADRCDAVTVVWRDGTPYCTVPDCEHAEHGDGDRS